MRAAPGGAELWIPALLIVAGLVGVVVPVVPGLLLTLAGVLLWALADASATAWVIFGISVVLYAVGVVTQYLVPGRRMREQGVGTLSMVLAVALGIVGFFVIPVLGAPLGFVLGIFLVELTRTSNATQAWARTRAALRAAALSMGIELLTGLAIAVTWVVGLLLTH